MTGAGGFVGRHVLSALAARPDLDLVVLSRSPLDNLPNHVAQLACDILDRDDSVVARLGPLDLLVHLAWGGLPNYRSLHHLDEELHGQFRFLRQLVEAGLPALQVVGTCYEYGMANGPQLEDNVGTPSNPYGFAKAALLRQLQFLRTQTPFRLTWARLFYMYGNGQAPTALYPLLRNAAARGDDTFPMSGGEQLRDYLPVEQVANALSRLAIDHQDAGVVNICSGQPVSIRRLVEGWIEEYGWSIKPDYGCYPYPDYEPFAFWGDRTKLDALLG